MARRTLTYRLAQVLGWATLMSIVAILVLTVVSRPPECLDPSPELIRRETYESPPCMFVDERRIYQANIVTVAGTVEVVLDPAISPTAVNAFIFLSMHRWYDGTAFHRIEVDDEHGFAQAGALNPDGTGHAGFEIEHEEPSPILLYTTGVLAGIVSGDPPRLGSQFFIVGRDWPAIGPPNAYPRYPPLGRIHSLHSLQIVEQLMQLGSPDGTPSIPATIDRINIFLVEEDQTLSPVTP